MRNKNTRRRRRRRKWEEDVVTLFSLRFFQCVHQEYLHRMPLVQDTEQDTEQETEQETEEEDLNDVLLK